MTKHTILFLAANPFGTKRLALDQEARAIQQELERSGHRDQFELVTRWAVQPLDLLRELRRLKPTIVHFSGHGSQGYRVAGPSDGPHRDVVGAVDASSGEQKDGLVFQGEDGWPKLVSTAALEDTFGAAGSSVKLVVLSACYSEPHAAALVARVDCVVGLASSIDDTTARAFAIGFYGGLGDGDPVGAAFWQGRAATSLIASPSKGAIVLAARSGVDVDYLVLAGPQVPHVDQLIHLLEDRAAHIRITVCDTYRSIDTARLLTRFNELHIRHLQAIRAQEFIRAHDLVGQIHSLFHEAGMNEWSGGKAVTSARRGNIAYKMVMPAIHMFGQRYLSRSAHRQTAEVLTHYANAIANARPGGQTVLGELP